MISFLFCLLLSLTYTASHIISPHSLHESRTHTPSGWSRLHKHHHAALLPLRIALAQSNIHTIESLLEDVSHPASPNYGAHWSPSRIANHFAPTDASVDAVRAWLIDSGLALDRIRLTDTKSWIHINLTVAEAERLLNTQYHVYKHDSGTSHIACDAYHIPEHVAKHVDFITPTVHFDSPLVKRNQPWRGVGRPGAGIFPKTTGQTVAPPMDLTTCDKQITPACLRALYGIPPALVPTCPQDNSYGIVEYTPQAYLKTDLEMFAAKYAHDIQGHSPVLVSIDGGVLQTSDQSFGTNGESDLDLQYGMALVTGAQPVTLYQVGDPIEGASFNNFLDALDKSYCTYAGGDNLAYDGQYPDPTTGGYQNQDCGTAKPANVISTSYGYNEVELSNAYIARQCYEYAKLGLMGVTVLYSSGDNGVAGNGGVCLFANGTEDPKGKIFNPTFPSTCPYVTSVGATQISPGKTVMDPETACEYVIQSGGGFSNYFGMPGYQKQAVGSYLDGTGKGLLKGRWNATGSRGYPDLSANGANYVVAVDGKWNLVYGTSASTPVVGAILTLVNDKRIAMGKKPIGFINPAIYSSDFKYAFHDITNGTNPGCGTQGFKTAKGWDPVTGLGTPNFMAMVEAWLKAK